MPYNPYRDAYNSAKADYDRSPANWFGNMLGGIGYFDAQTLMDDNARQYLNTMETNAMNYDAFLENRAYQAKREDFAIQRQVADMHRAGLNPAMLASAPSGASSNAGNSAYAEAKVPNLINVNLESAQGNQKANKTFLDFFAKILSFGLAD